LQEESGGRIQKWRFMGKALEGAYLLQSEDGLSTTSIPASWADNSDQVVKIKEELDLQRQQGNRQLVAVTETEGSVKDLSHIF